jgi:ribosomal protein S19|uniref:Small ribosomal subunit protein uS19c n=1 Tax=Thalassiosira pseudonana TaxID=35128 RepID=Q3S287_THAPS|nr:ribosomal protein S19 [Thalassiosira pseudonana]AAZ99417.1 ribosomal protein S19 [Thalassiosira pseudonana]QWM92937.1 ribosomal protein S19 [Thalassiosira pseudonana]
MSRVKWKGPYVTNNLLKKITNSFLENKNEIKTVSRDSVILPKFIGLNLRVYNGKTFMVVKIADEMVNYKLGEFVTTRKQFSYKKKKKK